MTFTFCSRTGAVLALALLLATSGCAGEPQAKASESDHGGHSNEGEGEGGEHKAVSFREGRGLLLPHETSEAIGLEVTEVVEASITPKFEVGFQVYQGDASGAPEGGGRTLASARVAPDVAQGLAAGATVEFEANGAAGALTGRVLRVDRFGGASQEAELVAEIEGKGDRLRPGDFLQGSIAAGGARVVTAVPESAVLTTIQGTFVYVANDEYFLRTAVKTGAKANGQVEIVEGVYAGDQVVEKPVLDLWLAELQLVKGGQGCAHGH